MLFIQNSLYLFKSIFFIDFLKEFEFIFENISVLIEISSNFIILQTPVNHEYGPLLCNALDDVKASASKSELVVSSLCQYDKAEKIQG